MGALTWLMLQMDDRYRLSPRFCCAQHRRLQRVGGPAIARAQRTQAAALHRAGRRRTGRLDDDRAEDVERQICRLAQMARHGHSPHPRHPAPQHRRGDRADQGQLPRASPSPSRARSTAAPSSTSRAPNACSAKATCCSCAPDAAKLFRLQGCFVSDDEIGPGCELLARADRSGRVAGRAAVERAARPDGPGRRGPARRHRPGAHAHVQHEHVATQAARRLPQSRPSHGAVGSVASSAWIWAAGRAKCCSRTRTKTSAI